jgi:hypothetical protein
LKAASISAFPPPTTDTITETEENRIKTLREKQKQKNYSRVKKNPNISLDKSDIYSFVTEAMMEKVNVT